MQLKMAQVFGLLPPIREIQMKFLAHDFSLTNSCNSAFQINKLMFRKEKDTTENNAGKARYFIINFITRYMFR